MKNKSKKEVKNLSPVNAIKPAYYILLFAYLLIPAYTPNFYTLDTNGPKFVSIGILNLISLFVFLMDGDFRKRIAVQSGFFKNFIGLAYTLFIAISLLSFTQVISIPEALVTFSKIFSVFASSIALYVIFSSNSRYILHTAVALVLVLLFDCFTVFYHIYQYVGEQVASIYDIKSVYSHKNILSASLFIKIPAALWLVLFAEGWKKKLGYTALLFGVLAVLFLSSRAFYLGLVVLTGALALFFVARHFRVKKNLSVKRVLLFAGLIVAALITFSVIQQYLYPVNRDTQLKFNTGLVERLSTIRADESSTNARLNNWKRSWILIQEHPFLGVGTGNWKLEVLKYEAPPSENFIISYKNHNDFIEVTAENGIPGGLIYLSIFVLILLSFVKIAIDPKADQEKMRYLFLPAFGILAYSIDAFFNFPNDRPEIQALFAMYVGMAIAFSAPGFSGKSESASKPRLAKLFSQPWFVMTAIGIFALFIGASTLFLYWNARSLHFQRYVFEDEKSNKYSHPASYFIAGFPAIPDLNCMGAPISTYISRYLINEKRSEEAINLMLPDKASPYDGRREYYLSMAYDKLGMNDSVIYWGLKTIELKPLLANMVSIVSMRLFKDGRIQEAEKITDNYLAKVKNNADIWLQATDQALKTGNESKALQLLDSAKRNLPGNKKILLNWQSLNNIAYIKPYEVLYKRANSAFVAQRYAEGLTLLNEFISKKPDLTEAYQNRALCYYRLGDFNKSLADIERAMKKEDKNEPYLLNLRGVNYISIGKADLACPDFKLAMEKGYEDGTVNYGKFCGPKVEKQETKTNGVNFIQK